MEILNIEKEKAINAYRVGSDEQKQVLELLFGVETLKPKTVMDRVKTFEDALKELKPFHPLVKEYKALRKADVTSNLIAYSKLCIVTAALNEGWTPKFIKGEKRTLHVFSFIPIKRLGTCRKKKNPVWSISRATMRVAVCRLRLRFAIQRLCALGLGLPLKQANLLNMQENSLANCMLIIWAFKKNRIPCYGAYTNTSIK